VTDAALDRLAARCVLPGFAGTEPPGWLLRWRERGLGGVVLFAQNVEGREQVARLTAAFDGLLVAVDEEGGDVTRLEARTGSSYPGALALGTVDDTALTSEVGAALAAAVAAAGITMNLAPVADVNTNPETPVIGVRSFGSDPELVARHVAAFVEGTQRQGVAACAKHFPGHGDTAVDSHLGLPVVESHLEDALVPFRAAVAAGVQAVMTGHLLVPGLDPDEPATMSGAVLRLLREELGFGGLVVTDALDMRAASGSFGIGEAAVRALAAGADALCLGQDSGDSGVTEVHGAIVDAVATGRVAAERVEEAAARVEAVVRWTSPNASGPGLAAAAAGARRGLLAEGDVHVDIPLVVELDAEPSIAAGRVGYGFRDAARRVWPDASFDAADADGRRLVLVLRDAGRRPEQQAAARELLARHPGAVVVETGLPGWRPEGAAGYVATLGAGRVNLDAAAELLARG